MRRAAVIALAVQASPATASAGAYSLTATNTAGTYAPTFTGNGVLGVRVPPSGQGYAPGAVPAQSELAGFYARPPGGVQQRANIPTWSTLTFGDGGATVSPTVGSTSGWHQTIDFRTGIVSTVARWRAPDGHVTDLAYQVLTDRANPNLAAVRLVLTPRWTGTASVTDTIDGTPATLTSQVTKGWNPSGHEDWVEVQTEGTKIDAALASRLVPSANVAATSTETDQATPATGRWPRWSTPASSTCGRARAQASTGVSPPPACRPTAMTATSSGTRRHGCIRRCSLTRRRAHLRPRRSPARARGSGRPLARRS